MESKIPIPELQRPSDSDCCGQGCQSCVFDLYDEELRIRQRRVQPSLTEHVQGTRFMSRDDYVQCQIVSVKHHCPNVLEIEFELPEKVLLRFEAGQHLVAQDYSNEGELIVRPYTIASKPGIVDRFTVLIKLYDEGAMSNIIRSKWKNHHRVSWRGPIGTTKYRANDWPCVVLVAAGTGIVPLYQIAREIVENDDDETRVTLLYSCRSASEIMFRNELHEMSHYWNFNSTYFLSNETEDVRERKKLKEVFVCSRLTEKLIVREALEKKAPAVPIYVCGPRDFENQVSEIVKRLGFQQVYTF